MKIQNLEEVISRAAKAEALSATCGDDVKAPILVTDLRVLVECARRYNAMQNVGGEAIDAGRRALEHALVCDYMESRVTRQWLAILIDMATKTQRHTCKSWDRDGRCVVCGEYP